MNSQIKSVQMIIVLVIAITMIATGCNLPIEKVENPVPSLQTQIPPVIPTQAQIPPTIPPEPTITATLVPQIVHKDLPGSPIGNKNKFQTVHDQVDEYTASQK